MSSLDDFFAKKDKRKKGKSKQNFVTSELLVKTIEVVLQLCVRVVQCRREGLCILTRFDLLLLCIVSRLY